MSFLHKASSKKKVSPFELCTLSVVDGIPFCHSGRQKWLMFRKGLQQIERSAAVAAEKPCRSSTERSVGNLIQQTGKPKHLSPVEA
jgi:hypothetical protein